MAFIKSATESALFLSIESLTWPVCRMLPERDTTNPPMSTMASSVQSTAVMYFIPFLMKNVDVLSLEVVTRI